MCSGLNAFIHITFSKQNQNVHILQGNPPFAITGFDFQKQLLSFSGK